MEGYRTRPDSLDLILERDNDSNVEKVIPSPASSANSHRPLEWDSGADVGYALAQQTTDLSTVERIALARGSILFGGTLNEKILTNRNFPLAESTPHPSKSDTKENQALDLRVKGLIKEIEPLEKVSHLLKDEVSSSGILRKSRSLDNLRRDFAFLHQYSKANSCVKLNADFISTSSIATVVQKVQKIGKYGTFTKENNERKPEESFLPSEKVGKSSEKDSEASFEFLPKYDREAEVENAVKLLRRYAHNLNVSDEDKFVAKVAQMAIDGLPSSSTKVESQTDKAEFARTRVTKKYSSRFSSINRQTASSSEISSTVMTETVESSLKSSLEKTSNAVSERSNIPEFPKRECRQKSQSANEALKEFLSRERECQLLWIKSGIDHLNNLKRLYESQKMLREDLHSVKEEEERNCQRRRRRNVRNLQPSSIPSVTFSTDVPSVTTDNTECSDGREKRSKGSLKWSGNKENEQPKKNRPSRQTRTENYAAVTKGQIFRNSSSEAKGDDGKGVAYTIFFDSKPVRDHIRQSNLKLSGCNSDGKMTQFQNGRNSVKKIGEEKSVLLRDYLLKNRPEYVDRAEYRRNYVQEIAKFRELCAKRRNELIAAVPVMEETTLEEILKGKKPVSTKLSTGLFNTLEMRRETEKKYKKLPEMVMKKLEQEKKDNCRKNQIMRKVFTKKLQKKVLKGKVNLSNHICVIAS